jgi:hypothetical protein
MKTIETTELAGVTGGATTAVKAVQNAVISQAGHAGLLDFAKRTTASREGAATRICGTFKGERDGTSHPYCGTYDPSLGAPSPDINVRDLAIH